MDYRERANECRELARTANAEERRTFLALAEIWEQLASTHAHEGFCQGDRGAVTISVMPIALTR